MQSAPFQSVSAWLRNVFAVRALPHDLEEGGELSRIAHDLGLTESELKMLARKGPQSPQLLYDRLRELGLDPVQVSSRAPDRRDYLRRPDLGRRLDADSQALLAGRAGEVCDLVLVIAEGLSPNAVNSQAAAVTGQLLPLLAQGGIALGPVVIASGARVALGDEIGEILGARMVAVLIGERPGLSAPDSLGAYLTHDPRVGRSDAERNCVSNIHGSGLGSAEAAFKIAWLIREALARRISGVALKDESGEAMQRSVPIGCDKSDT